MHANPLDQAAVGLAGDLPVALDQDRVPDVGEAGRTGSYPRHRPRTQTTRENEHEGHLRLFVAEEPDVFDRDVQAHPSGESLTSLLHRRSQVGATLDGGTTSLHGDVRSKDALEGFLDRGLSRVTISRPARTRPDPDQLLLG